MTPTVEELLAILSAELKRYYTRRDRELDNVITAVTQALIPPKSDRDIVLNAARTILNADNDAEYEDALVGMFEALEYAKSIAWWEERRRP